MGLLIFFVAFWLAVAGLVYGMMLAVEVIRRVQARQKIPALLKRSIARTFVGELCLIGIMLWAYLIGNAGNRAFAECVQSRENLREISTVLLQYSEDWDGWLPPASRWQDVISQPPYFTAAHAANVFTCPPNSVPCGYALNAAVAGAKVADIADPSHTVLLFETRHPARNASGTRHDLAPDRYRAIGLPMAFCDGRAIQKNKRTLRDVFWSPHETQSETKHPPAPPRAISELRKYPEVRVREVDPSLRTFLLTVGGLFLGSYLLLVQFWLWRWHRWSTRHWSGWLGAGWLLFLAGITGTLLNYPESPFWLWLLCLLGSMVCLLVAFWRYCSQQWALLSADRVVNSAAPPSLRRTWQTDPAGKRFILTRFGLTGGLALLVCAAVFLVYSRRLSADLNPFMTVVTLVHNGSLRADAPGTITLPPALAATTADGHVYLATAENERGQDQSVVYFPIRRSESYDDGPYGSSQLQIWTTGFVYSPTPLTGNYGIFFSVPNFMPVGGLQPSWSRPGWYDATGMD